MADEVILKLAQFHFPPQFDAAVVRTFRLVPRCRSWWWSHVHPNLLGTRALENEFPDASKCRRLHFSPSLLSVKRAFQLLGELFLGWLAPWGGKRAVCQGRHEIPERVCSCRARQPLASPAPSAEERKELGRFVAWHHRKKRSDSLKNGFNSVCLPSPNLIMCLLGLYLAGSANGHQQQPPVNSFHAPRKVLCQCCWVRELYRNIFS